MSALRLAGEQQVSGDFQVPDVLRDVVQDVQQRPLRAGGGQHRGARGAAAHPVGQIAVPDALGDRNLDPAREALLQGRQPVQQLVDSAGRGELAVAVAWDPLSGNEDLAQ